MPGAREGAGTKLPPFSGSRPRTAFSFLNPLTSLLKMNCNLILHCGARAVERSALGSVHTPEPTKTWQPIPHLRLVEQVEKALTASHLRVVNQAHSLSEDGFRYFGLMHIRNGHEAADFAWVMGLRNSHDMTYPAGIVAGTQVFVCDNLAFNGEVRFARKHTRNILRDLPLIAERAVARLVEKWHTQERRIAVYKERTLADRDAHDLIVRALDIGVIGSRTVLPVLNQWRKPAHEDFAPRTAWSLFNGFTETMKGDSLMLLPRRTEALHGLFDGFVGLASGRIGQASPSLAGVN
jgi:hypothetical protein